MSRRPRLDGAVLPSTAAAQHSTQLQQALACPLNVWEKAGAIAGAVDALAATLTDQGVVQEDADIAAAHALAAACELPTTQVADYALIGRRLTIDFWTRSGIPARVIPRCRRLWLKVAASQTTEAMAIVVLRDALLRARELRLDEFGPASQPTCQPAPCTTLPDGPTAHLATAPASAVASKPADRATSGSHPSHSATPAKSNPALLRRQVQDSVRAAQTVAEEITALLSYLKPRNAAVMRMVWGEEQWRPVSLTQVGKRFAVSRERIRQIVRREEVRMQRAKVAMPRAELAIAILERRGGMLTTVQWMAQCAEAGLPVSTADLRMLRALAALGLVSPVQYLPRFRLWLSAAGDAARQSGQLRTILARSTMVVHQSFRRTGAVPLDATDPRMPFGFRHATLIFCKPRLWIADEPDAPMPWQEVDGYALAPDGISTAHLDRDLGRLWSVAPRLSLRSFIKAMGRRRGRHNLMPATVWRAVLARRSDVAVTDTHVLAGRTDPRTVMTPVEFQLARAMRAAGGTMRLEDLVRIAVQAGHSDQTATLYARRAPYIRHARHGIYVLRGYRERRIARTLRPRGSDPILLCFQQDDARLTCRLRVAPMVWSGAVPLGEKSPLPDGAWTVTDGAGAPYGVQSRNGFLWSLARSWRALGISPGDIVWLRVDGEARTIQVTRTQPAIGAAPATAA